ncbi:MAG: ACT domain-containing protein, partial [Actinomycetota bacterium]
SYEEMLEMAASGARVLMTRAVEYARNYGVMIRVASSVRDVPGTFVREEDERMEKAIISGVTHDVYEAKVTVKNVLDRPGVAALLFERVAGEGINIDMIVQNVSTAGHTDISFTVPREDLDRVKAALSPIEHEIGSEGVTYDAGIAKVSLIGAGMKSHPGVAASMFRSLSDAGVNIEMISTSTIRISCVVREEDVARAVKAVHDTFLGSEGGDVTRSAHPA